MNIIKYRTHTCGELNTNNIGQYVILSGWIHNIRNFGYFSFLDLRDRFGITQLKINNQIYNTSVISNESIITIKGTVLERSKINENLYTGKIEVLVNKIKVLNDSKKIPIIIANKKNNESIRLKYRYLDLRSELLTNNIIMRNKTYIEIRKYLLNCSFLEIDTPILSVPTSEGARNFTVKYRFDQKYSYSLSQSPQIFKQLLMIGGFDKYFQFAKCFRDEDFRRNRQIEFTQLDCEMSFINSDEILKIFERLIIILIKKLNGENIKRIKRITYKEAIEKYGTDKPDTRYSLKFTNITKLVFNDKINIVKQKKETIAIKIPFYFFKNNNNVYKSLIKTVKTNDIKIKDIVFISNNIVNKAKYNITKKIKNNIKKLVKASKKDIIVIFFDQNFLKLGKLRKTIYKTLRPKLKKKISPLWITKFPLFKKVNNKLKSVHHPFTAPIPEHIKYLKTKPEIVKSQSYDLIINGIEIGGGSIRINKKDLQKKIFSLLGYSKQKIKVEFGFFLEALEFGTPPHGGIAFGIERLMSILTLEKDIKNFIAFPKNKYGIDLMCKTPRKIL
ncbi:aspartate--tRNA ligase [Candidatus Karelsulcia muelleri]|uniref:aspartate--tRNA ligase n=1 Tax=Candidatus Karelsulcia muelleri TaxID=336810 RepID=UPI002364747D|nr:aspartate--tRNA ligase [Candidatus Karelsulcia muelleri]WDE42148.1 aspartate--tRNA ligase [Candidatus Karelsulcia muelleri]WDR79137.1 aspartate--tRNA ligase [Candidatus Karelsulcia muelleri]